jgi:L-malate glycosyltransferase
MVCYPTFGGSGVVASELAVGLAKRGHTVRLIASAPPGRQLPACDRLTFHQVEAPTHPLFDHAPYDLAVASLIYELATAQRLDIVHVHYGVPHAISAYLARQMLGEVAPRVVVTLHGTDVTQVGADPSYAPTTRFGVAAADGVTVPSEYLRGETYAHLGVRRDVRIEVIPNFVDTEQFTPAEHPDRSHFDAAFGGEAGGPVLFHVSNFRSVKRVTDIIEMLAWVRQSLPARLVMVGDGPLRQAAATRVAELGLDASVRFLGNRADFARDLRHADAFVLASESESFGLAALESLSSGVPVVAYRVGGLPEVVSAEVGRLVPPLDVEALAGAVVDVVADRSRHAAMRRTARALAQARFQRGPAIERYEAHYRRVLEATRRS